MTVLGLGMLKFLDVPVDYSADAVVSFCIQLFQHDCFTSRKEVTGTFCFFPPKPAFAQLAQSHHFPQGICVMSLMLGIYDDSFSISANLTSTLPFQ